MYNKHKMHQGGANNRLFPNRLVRYSGLIFTLVLAIYGLLVQYQIIPSPRIFNFIDLILLVGWSFVIGVIQLISPSKSTLDVSLRLIAYHLVAGAYLVFIAGTASPFAAFWILLMTASYVYFSSIGLQLSIMTFVTTIAINIILWNGANQNDVTASLVSLITIILAGMIIMSVSKNNSVTRRELNQSKAQESLHRDRTLTIVNNLADGVLSTDMDGIIRVYNAASLNLIDTNISLNGHHIDEILPLIDQDGKTVSLFKDFKKIKTVVKRDDLNFKFSDGEEIRLEITYSPIHSSFSRSKKINTHDGYILIMRDITKAKSLEEERDEFISVVSHELRTPITISEGNLSNVQFMMNRPDVNKEILKKAVDVAHEQIIFLANMVNDLSTLSRAERGVSASAEDIDVKELAHKLFDKYTDEAHKKGLQLNLDLSPSVGKVRTSRLYLEELLQNFITNSIKYTKEGSVNIIIENRSGQVIFSVKDSGIGISKPDQVKVFGKFYRSEDYRTRETGGTGLGLYVAAKLAKKIGAKIELKSRLNFGSTFSFMLPEVKD